MDNTELLKRIIENQERFDAIIEATHDAIDDLEMDDKLLLFKLKAGDNGVEVIKMNLEFREEISIVTAYLKDEMENE